MLSVKEMKILNVIANDARISKIALARRVGISRELTEYHLKKLKERKIILGSQARINLNAFSIGQYNLFLKVSDFGIEKDLVGMLKKLKYTHFVARIGGDFDYVVGFSIKKRGDLQDYLDSVYEEFGEKILGHDVLTVTSEIKNDFSGLFGKESSGAKSSMVDIEGDVKLSEQDKIILKALSKDAGVSAVDLAGKCGMSAAGIVHRIKRLEKESVLLGYISEFDFTVLKKEFYYVYFSLKNPNKESVNKLKRAMLRSENVVFANQGVGGNSFLCLFFADSNKDLYEKILKFRRGVSEIGRQSVYLVLDFLYQAHLPEGFLD